MVSYFFCTKNGQKKKKIEALYTELMRLSLNEQCNFNVLTLFRKDITWFNYATIIINWFVFCLLSCS